MFTTGTIWVDKDSTTITANPFIPTATINAKGDLLVGSANDSIVTLSAGTNGYSLIADSSTTSGLTWTNTLTSPILNTAAANYAVMKSPEEKFNVVASAATGTINIDMETAGRMKASISNRCSLKAFLALIYYSTSALSILSSSFVGVSMFFFCARKKIV